MISGVFLKRVHALYYLSNSNMNILAKFKATSHLDMMARNVILSVVFLLPLVVVPVSWMPGAMIKMLVLSLGMAAALIMWLTARLREHKMSFPQSHVLWTSLLILSGYTVAALVSSNVIKSLVGYGYQLDTALMMFVMVSALVATAMTTRKAVHFLRMQKAILISFAILGVFQLLRVVLGADHILPSIFSADPTTTLLGSWNDLAVLGGLALLTTLSGLALFSARKARIGLYVVMGIALMLLIVVNLSVVWTTLLIAAFALAIYIFSDASYSRDDGKFKPMIPWTRLWPSLTVVVLSVIFLVGGSTLGGLISKTFGVQYVDIRPSWGGTMVVGAEVLRADPLLGAGPGFFSESWIQHKPSGVNETDFWNADFAFGVGLIPTSVITGGLVLGVLWLMLFIAFFHLGIKIFTKRIVQPGLMYVTLSSYVGAAYLLILSIVYIPQVTLLAYTFVFLGLAVAAGRLVGAVRTHQSDASESYSIGLSHMAVTVIAMVLITGSAGIMIDRGLVNYALARAVSVGNQGNLDAAEKWSHSASFFGDALRSSRVQVDIGTLRLAGILNSEEGTVEDRQKQFQSELTKTITAAQNVVAADSSDYRNWLALGDVYAQLSALDINGAYESAVAAYTQAVSRNPTNPLALATLSRLALTHKDYTAARSYAEKALELKSNYTDAYYLLSQIAIAEKKTDEAVTSTESAVLLRPDNAGLWFQLGILNYSLEAYDKVVPVLERAVAINPNYANALYFLGLAYDKTDNAEGALAAFKRIATLNPDNKDITAIVTALESGKSAFSALTAKAPTVSPSSALPVESQQ